MSTVPPGLKLKEAAPPGLKLKAPEAPSKMRTSLIAGMQGLTSGFSEELGAGVGQFFLGGPGVKPGPGAQPSPDDTPEVAAAKAALNAPKPSNYEIVRDGLRNEAKAAEEAHPELYTGMEMAGGIAQSFVPVAKGAGMAAKVGKVVTNPAFVGGLNALGHAEGTAGEQALQTAGGAAFGKVADTVFGGVGNALKGARKFVNGKKFESLAQKLKRVGGEANEEIVAGRAASKAKELASGTGSLGGNTAAVFNQADKYTKIIADPKASAKMKQEAQEILDSAEFRDALENAYGNSLESGKTSLKKLLENREAIQQTLARDPVEEAAQRGIKDVFLNDKSKKWYGGEAIRKGAPVAGYIAGDLLGGEEDGVEKTLGVGGGIVAGLMTGGRGSKVVNDLRSPEVRKFLAKGGQKLAQGAGKVAESLVGPVAREATDDIDEKYRALAEWLRRGQ
jgi:hypothetical protein